MTIKRPFPPRAGKPALRLVGGIDSTPSEPESLPAQRKRKERGPYKQQARKKYQNGLPVIDPAGEDDVIFRHIAEHRAAAAHYDRCVTVENDAEGKVSDDEYSHLQRNSRIAFDEMMLFARCVILTRPTTRRGLIHQARYLASQFSEDVGWDEGACENIYLPAKIDDRPWFAAFLRSLAAGLRKMAGELDPPPNEGGGGAS
jgi:hypothetical protein